MVRQAMMCCWIFLLTASSLSFSISIQETIFVEGGFESSNAFINFIVINGKRYIVKQKKNCERTIISVVRDALASYIAQDLVIAPLVKIISPADKMPGRVYLNCPASLMTIAPGRMIRALPANHKYHALSIKQRNINTFNKINEKITDKWLDESIIYQMTWHKQLPVIIALDIFIANTDRHRGNLFYDDNTDSFWAIDMDNIYRRDLAGFACTNIKKMIRIDKKVFTKQEIDAFKIMKKTLEFLMQKYKPKKLIAKLEKFAQQAGYKNGDSSIDHSMKKKIARHKEIIYQNYASCSKLVSILEGIINRSVDL